MLGAAEALWDSRFSPPASFRHHNAGRSTGVELMAPKLLLSRREAAESLGMSLSHFQRHVQPQIPCVYSGQLRLYRPRDLERWAEEEARAPRPTATRQSNPPVRGRRPDRTGISRGTLAGTG